MESNPDSDFTTPPPPSKEELARLKQEVSECILTQYAGTVIGLGLGVAAGVYKKSYMPLVWFGIAGSIGDLIYGYEVYCKPQVDAFKACQEKVDSQL